MKCRQGRFFFLFIIFLLLPLNALCAKEIALTIDDLPFVGRIHGDSGKYRREHNRFMKILNTLEQYHIPATGFVTAGSIEPGQWEWLLAFKRAGNILGNHSYSHKSLNHKPIDWYIADVQKADAILTSLLSNPKYYRFPYLAEGAGTPKYNEFRKYLFSHNYVIAPVTVDSKDFELNFKFLNIPWQKRKLYLNSFRQHYLNFIWAQTLRAQRKAEKKVHRPIKLILLIHMNVLNSYFLEDIIKLYQKHGYRFISLPEALQDPYYKYAKSNSTESTMS